MDDMLGHPDLHDAFLRHLGAYACTRLALCNRTLRDAFIEEAKNYRHFKTYGLAVKLLFIPPLHECATEFWIEIRANESREVESHQIASKSFQDFERRLALAVSYAKSFYASFRIRIIQYQSCSLYRFESSYCVYERVSR